MNFDTRINKCLLSNFFNLSSSSSSSSSGDRRKRRASRSKSPARKAPIGESKERDGKDRPKSRERARKPSGDRERDDKRDRASSKGRGGRRSRSHSARNRSKRNSRSRSASVSSRRKRFERSETPKPTRINVSRLTRNVTKDHVMEIFSNYGEIKTVDFPVGRYHNTLGRGYCYVEFMLSDHAENAMKHMDGGYIDGAEVAVAPVNKQAPMQMIRRSPMRGRGLPRNRWRGNDMRNRRRSPLRRSPRRR